MVHAVAVHDGLSDSNAHADWIKEAPWRRWRRSAVGEMESREEGVVVGGGFWVVRSGCNVRSTTTTGVIGASSALPLELAPISLLLMFVATDCGSNL